MCCIYQKNNNSFLFKISKGIHRKNVHQQELHRIRIRIISYISSEDMHFGLYGSGSIKDFNFFNFFFSLTLGKHGNLFSDLIPLLKWAKNPPQEDKECFGRVKLLYCTLLEKFWRISLHLTDDAIYCKAQCDVKLRHIEGNGRKFCQIELRKSVIK